MVNLEPLNGTLEPLKIARWLNTCEGIFEDEPTLEDKDKIRAAGRAISPSGDTESLRSWFTENRSELEELSWEEFKEALKDQALGTGWRMRALRDFFTTRSDGQTLQEYLTGLEHKYFILKRNDPDFKGLYENIYKWYLLFNAPSNLVDQVLKNEVYYDDRNLLLARPLEVQKWLRKYNDPAAISPSPMASQIASSGTYLHSGLSGNFKVSNGTWTDLVHLPKKSTDLGHMTSISILPANMFVSEGYSAENIITANNLTLDPGEYIKSVQVSSQSYDFGATPAQGDYRPAIDGIEIITSNPNKRISLGNLSSTAKTIAAPLGWRIVGFYGSYNENAAHRAQLNGAFRLRSRLGAIMLPV